VNQRTAVPDRASQVPATTVHPLRVARGFRDREIPSCRWSDSPPPHFSPPEHAHGIQRLRCGGADQNPHALEALAARHAALPPRRSSRSRRSRPGPRAEARSRSPDHDAGDESAQWREVGARRGARHILQVQGREARPRRRRGEHRAVSASGDSRDTIAQYRSTSRAHHDAVRNLGPSTCSTRTAEPRLDSSGSSNWPMVAQSVVTTGCRERLERSRRHELEGRSASHHDPPTAPGRAAGGRDRRPVGRDRARRRQRPRRDRAARRVLVAFRALPGSRSDPL